MNRILMVAIEPENVTPQLHSMGFSFDYAADARFATRLAADNDYVLGLFRHDLNLLNGIRLFRGIRRWQPRMVGVLIAEYANLNLVSDAITAGIRRILPAPLEATQLDEVLNSVSAVTAASEWSLERIATLTHVEVQEIDRAELIQIIRQVDYPYSMTERLEYFDRETLERVVHLVIRWCSKTLSVETSQTGVRVA